MLGARLADEGAHVDEARRDDVAGAIDDPRLRRRRIARHRGSQAGDQPADDEAAAARLGAGGRIDEAGVDEGAGALLGHGRFDSVALATAQANPRATGRGHELV